ncbi:MAG: hypothetical protein VR64_24010 [Desulfatitalea sp. BRH_c12]|nr:MAG: hypothetical protein VR64_24010 [Desulfatitalea sp. BRH_c12]
MPIRIAARQAGYCRCNTVFATAPAVYPDGHFDPRQLQILKADPNLVVTSAAPATKNEDAADAAADQMRSDIERTMTVAKLREELGKMDVPIPDGAKKADLIDLIMAVTAQAPDEA